MIDPHRRSAKFWKKPSALYPDVCTCIGTPIGFFHDRYWWHATGKTQEDFKTVEADILEQLRADFTDTYSSILHFHLYMIGRSMETAIPTIMFFCEEKEPRKRAKKTFEDGGILVRLPGFRTGHQAKQPGVGSLIQPATENDRMHQSDTLRPVFRVYYDPSQPILAIGMPIFVEHNNGVIRRATANAVFEEQKCVLMSVAHVFFETLMPEKTTPIDSDSNEYDFGSGTELEDDEDDEDGVDMTSLASISSREENSDDSLRSDSPELNPSGRTKSTSLRRVPFSDQLPCLSQTRDTDLPVSPREGHDHFMELDHVETAYVPPIESLNYLGGLTKFSNESDWALIDIQDANVYNSIFTLKMTASNDRNHTRQRPLASISHILAHTAHGIIPGLMSQNPTYMRLPYSTAFQKIYEITLDAPLDWGDCGAGVSDTFAAVPHGHIVASSINKRIAYIVAALEVMRESGTRWNLPSVHATKASIIKFEQQAITASGLLANKSTRT